MGNHGVRHRRGVEQWQLVGLITRRSMVRIHPPLPNLKKRQEHQFLPLLFVFGFLIYRGIGYD